MPELNSVLKHVSEKELLENFKMTQQHEIIKQEKARSLNITITSVYLTSLVSWGLECLPGQILQLIFSLLCLNQLIFRCA